MLFWSFFSSVGFATEGDLRADSSLRGRTSVWGQSLPQEPGLFLSELEAELTLEEEPPAFLPVSKHRVFIPLNLFLLANPDLETNDHLVRRLGLGYTYNNRLTVYAGREVFSWGKTDEINPVDVLNGQDFSRFLSIDKADRKMPREAALIQFSGDDWSLTAIALEGIGQNTFADGESDWCRGACQEAALTASAASEHESQKFESFEFGTRALFSFRGFDLGLYGFHIGSRQPIFTYQAVGPQTVQVTEHNPQKTLHPAFGFDAQTTLGRYGLRAETLYEHNAVEQRAFAVERIGQDPEQTSNLRYVLGVDTPVDSDFYANLQWGGKHFATSSSTEEDLPIKTEPRAFFTVLLRHNFFEGDVTLQLRGTHDTDDGGSMIRPRVAYVFSDTFALWTQAYFFRGASDSFFGTFSEQSHAQVGADATF